MVGAAADLMSIHLMEGCVAMVTQPGDFVLASSGDVFHHQGQQAYGPTLLQHSHRLCCTKKKKTGIYCWTSDCRKHSLVDHMITTDQLVTYRLTRSAFLPVVLAPLHFSQCLSSTMWSSLGSRPHSDAPGMSFSVS